MKKEIQLRLYFPIEKNLNYFLIYFLIYIFN
jgi:hypothetical protein